MDELTHRLNGIENDVKRLLTIVQNLSDTNQSNSQHIEEQAYYTLKEAVRKKYGPDASYQTIACNYFLMPCCNTNFKIIGGCRRWDFNQIAEWISVCDSDIPAYAAKYNVPLVGRLGEKYKKYIKGGTEQ